MASNRVLGGPGRRATPPTPWGLLPRYRCRSADQAVGVVGAQPDDQSAVAHHGCPVVVPVVVLALEAAVEVDELLDRGVVRRLGHRRDLSVSLEDDVGPEAPGIQV